MARHGGEGDGMAWSEWDRIRRDEIIRDMIVRDGKE